MISYKYNIYHSKKTKYLDKMLRECCFVWNHALALQRRYYRLFGKYIPVGKMQKHFAKRVKRILLHSQTIQEILQRLDSAYNRFFKKLAKRPPKFKRSDCFNSFVFKQGGFTLNGNCLTINKGKNRTWVCPSCGAINDRDVLAARNILRKGISELESKSNSSDSNIGVSCVCIQESHLL